MQPHEATILLVEDEIIIALDTQELLAEMGFCSVTVAHNLRRARMAVDQGFPDIALLDVNLGGGEMTIALGRDLGARGAQVIFATGYNRSEMEAEHPDLIFVEKPLSAASISDALERSTAAR